MLTPIRIAASVVLMAALAACNSKPAPSSAAESTAGSSAATEPPAKVSVIIATPTVIAVSHRLPGRLQAYREAEVRARVAGIITARLYREGQQVHKGSKLFQIDSAPLKAAFDIAAAALEQATANAALAADKLRRYDALVTNQAVSRREHAEAVAENRLTNAQVASARAVQRRAQLELGYASVTAPIAGRARRALVTEGALVGHDTATPLTTIEQIDPIYVNFSQPASEVASMQQAIRSGALHGMAAPDIAVQLILPDGGSYPHAGKLIFTDLAIDPATDTIAMRAVLPNPDHQLLPGGYVQLALQQARNTTAILIPRHALLRTANAATVLVVDADNKIAAVAVQTDGLHHQQWLISDGLRGGEKVIVANVATLQVGSTVIPQLQPATAMATATAAATTTTTAAQGS